MKLKLKLVGIFMLLSVTMISLSGCVVNENKDKKKTNKISSTELFMGTSVTITVYEKNDEEIIKKAFDKVKEIESLVSINKLGTELDEINNNAGIKAVSVSEDSFNIIEKALDYSEKSEGGYDLTIGPLVKLWSIGLPEAKVPEENEIKGALEKINYKKVNLNKEKKEVYLEDKDMKIDLGSIAKGYTADEVAKVLGGQGVKKAIIDLGGNIYALGEKEENTPWKIGIQNPFENRGELVGTIEVKDKSIVTSGIYERYLEKDGKKYHHILNTKTGYPYEGEIAGVTLITDKSMDGDALSTLIFTMGIKDGLEFLEELDNVDAIFVSKDKEVHLTKGVKDTFELTNKGFVLMN